MKYSNKHGIPEAMASALTNDSYSKGEADFSVTELDNPPLQRWLLKKHDDEVVIDCSERLFSMLGTAVHHVIEQADHDNALSEERLFMTIDGVSVSGAVDQYSPDNGGTVRDWKVTSMYVYQGKTKEEWIHQANGYASLFRANGFPVVRLEDWAILRDWSRAKYRSAPQDYPPVPFQVVRIPLRSDEETIAHMKRRIGLHQAADKATCQEEIEVCNEQERWTKEPEFACIKEGNKKASKVFKPTRDFGGDGPEEIEMARLAAQDYADMKGIDVVARPGEETRCLFYCPVKEFCRFGKELQA